VDVVLDLALVELAHARHGLVSQRRQVARRAVVVDLRRAFGAGDDTCNRVVHQDPAQRERRHARLGGRQLAQLLDRLQAELEGHARERLPLVPVLAVAVVAAVVVLGELARARHLARQHP
jgi:hypothetical protein